MEQPDFFTQYFNTLKAIGKLAVARLEKENIPYSFREHFLLKIIDSQCATQTEIAEIMTLDKSGILRYIDILEKMGLIQRVSDNVDRRKKNLMLTEAGKAYFIKSTQIIEAVFAEVRKGIPQEKIDLMREILVALDRNAQNL